MLQSQPFAKMIPCPEHPEGRAHWWDLRRHQAILFLKGSTYAGVWECTRTGVSDNCEHGDGDWRIETVQVDYWPTPDIDHSYDVEVYVCNLCGQTIDRDVADPAEDRHDAMVDAEIDYARGK